MVITDLVTPHGKSLTQTLVPKYPNFPKPEIEETHRQSQTRFIGSEYTIFYCQKYILKSIDQFNYQ